jgi:hypothetical protein
MVARSFGFLTFLLLMFGTSRGAAAQTAHAAPEAALDAAVHQHVPGIATDREAILRVLRCAEVKAVAGRAGIDLRPKEAAVATLQGEDLARVASLARKTEDSLAGGTSTRAGAWAIYILGIAIVPLILVLIWAF